MSKLFAYKHAGTGGCNKTAFFTLTRPQPGQSLADCVVISVEGFHVKQEGALMCGHCGNGVLGLKLNNLKPARHTSTVDLLVRAVNNGTMAKAEVSVVTENLQLLHEAVSKMHPAELPDLYAGSALESSIKDILGEEQGSGILDADGAQMESTKKPVDNS